MKRSIFQIVGLLLLLPLFSGCNDSDDVAAIFTGKTWKLNYITVDGGHEMFGFWENEEQEKASNGVITTLELDNISDCINKDCKDNNSAKITKKVKN